MTPRRKVGFLLVLLFSLQMTVAIITEQRLQVTRKGAISQKPACCRLPSTSSTTVRGDLSLSCSYQGGNNRESYIHQVDGASLEVSAKGRKLESSQSSRVSFKSLRRHIHILSKTLKLFMASSIISILFGFVRVSRAATTTIPSTVSQSSSSIKKTQNPVNDVKYQQIHNFKKKVIVEVGVSKDDADDTIQNQIQHQGVKQNIKTKTSIMAKANPAIKAKKHLSIEGSVFEELRGSLTRLKDSLSGAKLDTLILLIVTSTIIPLFTQLGLSPIIGFLMTGTLLGPTGLSWVKDVHMIDHLGDFGIVFFLFEMGLELSLEKLQAMRKDVFGLGSSQFIVTSAIFSLVSMLCGMTGPQSIAIGGSLALSSSAFVLQLLKDKEATGTIIITITIMITITMITIVVIIL